MSWLRLDDGLVTHPKIFQAARELGGRYPLQRCICFYVEALTFASSNLTDGHFDRRMMHAFASDTRAHLVCDALVAVGLIEATCEDTFMIHDYHDYNPSAQEIRARREHDRDRKRVGRRKDSGRTSGGTPGGIRPSRAETSHVHSAEEGGSTVSVRECKADDAPPPDLSLVVVTECVRAWERRWPGELHQPTPAHLLELQRHGESLGVAEVLARYERYLASPKAAARKHPLAWFVRQIAEWGQPEKPKPVLATASERFLARHGGGS